MAEKEIQKEILKSLDKHPYVVWAYITTAGVVKGHTGGRPFRIGPNGLLDILGQLADGRLFSIEVKAPGKKPTKEQYTMIDRINNNGGVAGWADNVTDAFLIIDKAWGIPDSLKDPQEVLRRGRELLKKWDV